MDNENEPTSMNHKIAQIEGRHTSGVYPKRDLTLVRGSGARVWDADGGEYLDCVTGFGVANLGHCHPAIVEAIQYQSLELLTCPEIFYNDRRAELLEALAAHLPGDLDRTFLCNSGTEAVEGAFKFARLLTGRQDIVAFKGAFHGRTMGALSATWKESYRKPFGPLVPNFHHLPFNDLAAAQEAITRKTAAVMVEPIQGEGGVNPASSRFLQGLRDICDDTGTLLIFDEVQTGFGRTGDWFACQRANVIPDIMCLGKAMAGGVPVGAVTMGPRCDGLPKKVHGSTFGGNPLACAAAFAAIQAYEAERLPQQSASHGTWLKERLEALEATLIRNIRGRGLMVGLDLRIRVAPVIRALQERGVLALPAGPTVLRLLPPLVITLQELEQVAQALETTLSHIQEAAL